MTSTLAPKYQKFHTHRHTHTHTQSHQLDQCCSSILLCTNMRIWYSKLGLDTLNFQPVHFYAYDFTQAHWNLVGCVTIQVTIIVSCKDETDNDTAHKWVSESVCVCVCVCVCVWERERERERGRGLKFLVLLVVVVTLWSCTVILRFQ